MGQFRRCPIALVVVAVACLPTVAGPVPKVTIGLPGKFGEFRLTNRGEPVQFDSSVKVQQQIDGEWRDTHVANLYLISSCKAGQPPRCVSLASGAVFQPAAWSGNYCSAQCTANCNLDGPVPPGVYRYVATSCDGMHRFFSAPFEKKARDVTAAQVPRN
jgi:hypothetical protein